MSTPGTPQGDPPPEGGRRSTAAQKPELEPEPEPEQQPEPEQGWREGLERGSGACPAGSCPFCHSKGVSKPVAAGHSYCGRTCAQAARAAGWVGDGQGRGSAAAAPDVGAEPNPQFEAEPQLATQPVPDSTRTEPAEQGWREGLELHLQRLLRAEKTKSLRDLAAASGASEEAIDTALHADGGAVKAVKAAFVSLLREHALRLAELPLPELRRLVESEVEEDDILDALDECEESGGDEREVLIGLLAAGGMDLLLSPRVAEAPTPRSARWGALLADPTATQELAAAAQEALNSWRPQRWKLATPLLGRGGGGVVFRSSDSDLGTVALKFAHSDEPRKLEREVRLMRRVAHPHVCDLREHHISADGKLFCMVLELLDGGNLEQAIKQAPDKRLREFEVVRMAFDVLAALSCVHGKNVIHRDIKPSNIMLAEVDGRQVYKIIDFSISAVEREARADVAKTLRTGTTSLGALAGTAHYMSPEQIQEGCVVTPQTDLWSLGVVMFECLSGVLPFAPAERDRFRICYAIVSGGEPPELCELVEEVGAVSESMATVVRNALQKNLSQRYATATEMSASLDDMLTTSGHERFALFISYRVWCDKMFAEALYRAASRCQLRPGREHRMKVYLDKVRIVDGQRFDTNFAKGLANSTVFTPLVSSSCLKNFVELGQEDKEDFVLAEWLMAIELQKRGVVRAIFPVMIGEQRRDGTYSDSFFEDLRNGQVRWPASKGHHEAGSGSLPQTPSAKSTALARKYLGLLEPPIELSEEITVKEAVDRMCGFQAVLLHFMNADIDSVDGIELVRVGSTHGTRAKTVAQKHVAQACAERIAKIVTAHNGTSEADAPAPTERTIAEHAAEHTAEHTAMILETVAVAGGVQTVQLLRDHIDQPSIAIAACENLFWHANQSREIRGTIGESGGAIASLCLRVCVPVHLCV